MYICPTLLNPAESQGTIQSSRAHVTAVRTAAIKTQEGFAPKWWVLLMTILVAARQDPKQPDGPCTGRVTIAQMGSKTKPTKVKVGKMQKQI